MIIYRIAVMSLMRIYRIIFFCYRIKTCDELIETAAIKWHMSRLCGVDRSILRLSTYQLKFCEDIPPRVVINEAIEIAKKYSSDQSPKFVNGVLDAIMQKVKESKQ